MAVDKRKRRLTLILPVFAVILISSVSVAYAIYGDLLNTSNTTDPQYVIVTPQGTHAYSEAFSNTLQFDTENRNGTITFKLSSGQTSQITVATVEHDVVLLGELLLNTEQTGMSEDYVLSFKNVAGTMTGTFYTAVSTSEDNVTFSDWTYSAYTIGTGSSFNVDNEIEWIKLRLYVDAAFQTEGPLATMPLQSVSFEIKATIE